jgi:hypothetical protein
VEPSLRLFPVSQVPIYRPPQSKSPTVSVRKPRRSTPNVSAIHFTFRVQASICFFKGPGRTFESSSVAVVTNRQGRGRPGRAALKGRSAPGPSAMPVATTFDRRTGEQCSSVSGSARSTVLLCVLLFFTHPQA